MKYFTPTCILTLATLKPERNKHLLLNTYAVGINGRLPLRHSVQSLHQQLVNGFIATAALKAGFNYFAILCHGKLNDGALYSFFKRYFGQFINYLIGKVGI